MPSRRQFLQSLPLATAAFAAGCKRKEIVQERYRLPKKPLEVLTSTVQAAELLKRIGGEAVNVRSFIAPQANPHLWKPTAHDIATARMADVLVLNGLGLEAGFTEDLDALRSKGLTVCELAKGLGEEDILRKPDGRYDPHFWMNPVLWAKAGAEAASVLSEAAPKAATYFTDRSHEFSTDVERLHAGWLSQFQAVVPRARFVLSTHDSLAYFGQVYGVEVRSLATANGDAPAKIPEELAQWIAGHRVRSLFRESFADAAVIRELVRPLFLSVDSQLFSLSLGQPGTVLPSTSGDLLVSEYLQAHQYNVESVLGRIALE